MTTSKSDSIGVSKPMLVIDCNGGLGNRIRSLCSGLYLYEAAELPFVILWPKNPRCDASYTDLFDPIALAFDQEVIDLLPRYSRLVCLLHEPYQEYLLSNTSPREFNCLEQILEFFDLHKGLAILFSENNFLAFMSENDKKKSISRIGFNQEIRLRFEEVLAKFPKNFYGVHLRGTDFPGTAPIREIYQLIESNRDASFFVCSDEYSIEKQLGNFKNVYIHEKKHYVQKIGPGDWNSPVDIRGINYSSNVFRSGESLIEACVDLLLLSRSEIINTSTSSFLEIARYFKADGNN